MEYNFGPASFSVWATQEVYANASGAAIPLAPGVNEDISAITQGIDGVRDPQLSPLGA